MGVHSNGLLALDTDCAVHIIYCSSGAPISCRLNTNSTKFSGRIIHSGCRGCLVPLKCLQKSEALHFLIEVNIQDESLPLLQSD